MTYRDQVAAYLRKRRGAWVDGLELAHIGGAYAWRSRVSECRTMLGMKITNRERRAGARIVSEYRYEGRA